MYFVFTLIYFSFATMKRFIELKKEFYKNGIETTEKIPVKNAIVHTQLHKEDGYYIYQVNYSGNIHYVAFKEQYSECADVISIVYPSDQQFYKKTAINFTNVEDAFLQIQKWKLKKI
jgi:hypothetical protein